MNLSVVVVIVYGTLTIVGGLFGYLKSRSKASIVSGSFSGLLLILSAWVYWQGQRWGLLLGAIITSALIAIFAVRFKKTRQFIPAGSMAFLGAVTLAILISQLRT